MDPLLAVSRLPTLAERAMRRALLAALERGKLTPRGLINDALMRFERDVQREAPDGVRPALLFNERDRIVRELRTFVDGRFAARLAGLRPREVLALGAEAAPFDAIVENRFGERYGIVLRRLRADGSTLETLRRIDRAARRYPKVPLRGAVVYDFSSGKVRCLNQSRAQSVNGDLRASRQLHLRKNVRDVVLDRLVG